MAMNLHRPAAAAPSAIGDSPRRRSYRRNSTEGELSVKKDTVSTLLGYVPQSLVAQILKTEWNGDRRMECETFWACCVFVDISGFSTLASDLQGKEEKESKSGRKGTKMGGMHGQGAESLTKFLNNTLRRLIGVIIDHGGDIVKFAGDAMIVVWREVKKPGEKAHVGKARAAAAAIKCSLNCLLVSGDKTVTPSHSPVPLTRQSTAGTNSPLPTSSSLVASTPTLKIHVGIGVGNIVGFHVGGLRNRWEYFVMGDACNQMNYAESLAKVGEVVISKATLHLLVDYSSALAVKTLKKAAKARDFTQIVALDYAANEPAPVSLMSKVSSFSEDEIEKLDRCLRSYIPNPIVTAVDEGESLENDGVLRELCVLFIKLNNLASVIEPNGALEREADKIQRTVATVQEAAYHGRATLRQFIIDDKGAVAIVVVGLPPVTAIKTSSRGLKIGMRILEHGVPAQIGITTGICYCGTIGSRQRGDFAVVGDHINMAARLMSAAEEGSLLCDSNTMNAAQLDKSLFFGEGKKLRVKGKKEPIKVYSPSRKINSVLGQVDFLKMQRSPLIGNANVWKTLTQMHKYRQTNPLQFVTISGPKSSGKTKIINMFQNMQKLEKVAVLTSRADKFEETTPYFVFRSILYNIFEHGLSNTSEREKLEEDEEEVLLALFSRSTASADFGTAKSADENDDVNDLITLRRSPAESKKMRGMLAGSKGGRKNSAGASTIMNSHAKSSRHMNLDEIKEGAGMSTGLLDSDDDDYDEELDPEDDSSPVVDNAENGREFDITWKIMNHPIVFIPNVKWLLDMGYIDADTLALLNLIMPSFDIPETEEYKCLEPHTKEIMLRDLMVELLGTVKHGIAAGEHASIAAPRGLSPTPPADSVALRAAQPPGEQGLEGLPDISPFSSLGRNLVNGSLSASAPAVSTVGELEQFSRVSFKKLNSGMNLNNSPKTSVTQSTSNYFQRHITMIFDDFHNIDEKSIKLMKNIMLHRELGNSIMLVVSTLDEQQDRNAMLFTASEAERINNTSVQLEYLSRSEISSVLFSEFSFSSIDKALMNTIYMSCKGNPGKAIDYLRKLVDMNLLLIDEALGTCKLTDPNALEKFVSDDIHLKATSLFDGIDAKSKFIVQLASVTGEEIPLKLLEEMYVSAVGRGDVAVEGQGDETGKFQPARGPRMSIAGLATIMADQKEVALELRRKAFTTRVDDLVDAKIFISQDNMVRFRVDGISQVAYDFSLHGSKAAAHQFTVEWYERECTPEGLRANSSFLYNQCLNFNKFDKAAEFLYECSLLHLSQNKSSELLKLLGTADHMLGMWKAQVISQRPDLFEQLHITKIDGPPQSARGWELATAAGVPLSRRESGPGSRRSSCSPKQERRASLDGLVKEVSLENKPELIGPVCTTDMSQEQKEGLLEVEYCEMRCRFFESQAYVETQQFPKSMKILKVIIDWSAAHGATAATKVVSTSFMGRFLSKAACGGNSGYNKLEGEPNWLDSGGEEGEGNTEIGPHRVAGDPVNQNDINSLFASATKVYVALKKLMAMQEQQQQMLRRIAQVTQQDLAVGRDSDQGFDGKNSGGELIGRPSSFFSPGPRTQRVESSGMEARAPEVANRHEESLFKSHAPN